MLGVTPGVDFILLPATQTVKVGQVFTVNILVDASAKATDAVQAYVDFNPAFIKVVDASGNILADNAANPIIPGNSTDLTVSLQNIISNTNGTAGIAYGMPVSGTPATTVFLLGTIRFKAITDSTSIPLIFHTSGLRYTQSFRGGVIDITQNRIGANVSIAPLIPPTVVSTVATGGGTVQTAFQLKSSDGKYTLDIPGGTILHDSAGNALNSFSISGVASPPAAPSGSAVVFAYNFGPDGAKFNPPLTLTMNYDPTVLPAGTNETELYIAWWDGANWQALTGTVNTTAKTVSVQVVHFTPYALLSKQPALASPTPPVPAQTPEKFTVAGLTIAPSSVKTGETFTVNATVTNSGGTQGTYSAILKVNGVQEATKDLTLNAGASENVSFTLKKSTAGNYYVDVNGQTGQFTVTADEAILAATPTGGMEGGSTTIIIGILVVAAVLAGALAYYLLRKRRA